MSCGPFGHVWTAAGTDPDNGTPCDCGGVRWEDVDPATPRGDEKTAEQIKAVCLWERDGIAMCACGHVAAPHHPENNCAFALAVKAANRLAEQTAEITRLRADVEGCVRIAAENAKDHAAALAAAEAKHEAELVRIRCDAHGEGQEHTLADVNAGLIDDLIEPRLALERAKLAAAEAERDKVKAENEGWHARHATWAGHLTDAVAAQIRAEAALARLTGERDELKKQLAITSLAVPLEEEISNRIDVVMADLAMGQASTVAVAQILKDCQRRIADDWQAVGGERRRTAAAESSLTALRHQIAGLVGEMPDLEAALRDTEKGVGEYGRQTMEVNTEMVCGLRGIESARRQVNAIKSRLQALAAQITGE